MSSLMANRLIELPRIIPKKKKKKKFFGIHHLNYYQCQFPGTRNRNYPPFLKNSITSSPSLRGR